MFLDWRRMVWLPTKYLSLGQDSNHSLTICPGIFHSLASSREILFSKNCRTWPRTIGASRVEVSEMSTSWIALPTISSSAGRHGLGTTGQTRVASPRGSSVQPMGSRLVRDKWVALMQPTPWCGPRLSCACWAKPMNECNSDRVISSDSLHKMQNNIQKICRKWKIICKLCRNMLKNMQNMSKNRQNIEDTSQNMSNNMQNMQTIYRIYNEICRICNKICTIICRICNKIRKIICRILTGLNSALAYSTYICRICQKICKIIGRI